MRAARWDTVWEIGGLWHRVLRRRLADGTAGEFADPCQMVLLHEDGTTLLTLAGVLSTDHQQCTFHRSSTQTAAMAAGTYRHRLTVGDPELDDTVMLLRGFVLITDEVPSP